MQLAEQSPLHRREVGEDEFLECVVGSFQSFPPPAQGRWWVLDNQPDVFSVAPKFEANP
jgi:hypothetical protein